MPRIRRNNQRIRAGAGRTRKEDCCCDEPDTIPDCPDRLPLTWLLRFSNMPALPTGKNQVNVGDFVGFFACTDPQGYPPWQYCSTFSQSHGANRNYHSIWKGFCDQITQRDWELPYLGGFNWGLTGLSFPQAQMRSGGGNPNSCLVGPQDVTNRGLTLSVSHCYVTGGRSDFIGVSVSFANLLGWDKQFTLLPGQTVFDIAPLVITTSATQNENLACSSYVIGNACIPTSTFIQGPTVTIFPNG